MKSIITINVPDADFQMVNKKPILPTDDELKANNRSHSAKLRVLRRVK